MKNLLSYVMPLILLFTLIPQTAWATLDVAANLTEPFTVETTPAETSYIRFRRDWASTGTTKVTINLQYRIQTNNSGSWEDWTTIASAGTTTVSQMYGNSIKLTAGTAYKIQFRGINESGFSTAGVNGTGTANNYNITLESSSYTWTATMYGNIMSLIKGYDTDDEATAKAILAAADEIPCNYCFAGLFYNNNGSYSTYPPVTNAENLIFPAVYLKEGCYRNLFYQYNRSDNSFKGGLNEGPVFLATDWNNKSGSHVKYTFLNLFNQCINLKSAHFSFTSCPTDDDFNFYSVYTTPDNKTLYAPAGFNPISCAIGTWNGGYTEWSYDGSSGGGDGGGSGSSDQMEVDVYQAAATDTTKILYPLPANAVDLGTGVAWATTDYDASTASKFAADTRGAMGLKGAEFGSQCNCDPRTQITQDVWYAYSDVTPPAGWRMPTQEEFGNLTENNTSYINLGTNNKRLQVTSRISNDYIYFSAVGYVLYGSDGSYYYYNCVWQNINFPYYWITQTAYFGINTSTQVPEIGGCDASCMMPARFVYAPSNTHTLTVHVGERTYTYQCGHGQSVTVTAHADDGYDFLWWSDDHSNTTAEREFIVNNDIEVTAVFTYDSSLPKHTVTFVNWDGSLLYRTDVPEGVVPVYSGATPTRAYWEFAGWSPALTAMGTADVTYTATFTFESAPAAVAVYQGAAADTMKILYNLDAKTGLDGKTYRPVDMGYGVAWADRNVGATSTTNVGSYFYWGDTEGHTSFNANQCLNTNSYVTGSTLTSDLDAATQQIGAAWHMPTDEEWLALKNGANQASDGGTFVNKTDGGNTIFLPASGFYGTSYRDLYRNGDEGPWTSKLFTQYRFYWSSVYYVQNAYSGLAFPWTFEDAEADADSYYYLNTYFNYGNKQYGFFDCFGMPVRAIYKPLYQTYMLTINVGTKRYQYICQAGQEITVTANATVSGYVFDQWAEDGNTDATRTFTVTDDMFYTATFKEEVKNYTLTWTTDGDALTGDYTVGTVAYGTPIVAPATPTKTGYTFDAWTPAVAATMPAANTEYTATWITVTYNLTYEGLEGAANSNPATYTIETPAITLAAPGERDGYTFAGWTCGGETITEIAHGSTGDMTLTANWTAEDEPVYLLDDEDDTWYDNFKTRYNNRKVTAIYERTFKQSKWSTLTLPFDVSRAAMTSQKLSSSVYEFKYATGETDEGNGVTLYFSKATSITAGRCYVVNANKTLAAKTTFTFSNVLVNLTNDNVAPLADASDYDNLTANPTTQGSIELVGTLRKGILIGGTKYMGLKDNKIFYTNTSVGTPILAYHGLFRLISEESSPVRFRIVADGEDMGELEIIDGELYRADGDRQDCRAPIRKFFRDGVLYIERDGIVYDAQGKKIVASSRCVP